MSRNRHKHTRLLKFYSLVTGKIFKKEEKKRKEGRERREKKQRYYFARN